MAAVNITVAKPPICTQYIYIYMYIYKKYAFFPPTDFGCCSPMMAVDHRKM